MHAPARRIMRQLRPTPLQFFLLLLPFLLRGNLNLLAVPPQPLGHFVHERLRLVVNLAIVLGDRLGQFLEGDETVGFTMGAFLVLACQQFEEPVRREGQVIVPPAERWQVQLLVFGHGTIARIDRVGDGVDPTASRLK